jgi:hypothetical protein
MVPITPSSTYKHSKSTLYISIALFRNRCSEYYSEHHAHLIRPDLAGNIPKTNHRKKHHAPTPSSRLPASTPDPCPTARRRRPRAMPPLPPLAVGPSPERRRLLPPSAAGPCPHAPPGPSHARPAAGDQLLPPPDLLALLPASTWTWRPSSRHGWHDLLLRLQVAQIYLYPSSCSFAGSTATQ